MFMQAWKKEITTVPNILSLLRILLIPVYMTLYLNAETPKEYYLAGFVLALSCLTDAMDGKIARHFNMVSNLGKILDPLADKITQLTLTFSLSVRHPALNPVLILLIMKEVFQVSFGIVHLKKGHMLPGALMTGKICTTVLFVSLTLLVLFPSVSERFIRTVACVDMFFLSISFISYIFTYCGKQTRFQDL